MLNRRPNALIYHLRGCAENRVASLSNGLLNGLFYQILCVCLVKGHSLNPSLKCAVQVKPSQLMGIRPAGGVRGFRINKSKL